MSKDKQEKDTTKKELPSDVPWEELHPEKNKELVRLEKEKTVVREQLKVVKSRIRAIRRERRAKSEERAALKEEKAEMRARHWAIKYRIRKLQD